MFRQMVSAYMRSRYAMERRIIHSLSTRAPARPNS